MVPGGVRLDFRSGACDAVYVMTRVGVDGDNSWTLTSSGLKLIYLSPQVEMICMDDITNQLSMLCRFTGATSQFYSVAQHSIFVGQLVKHTLDADGADGRTVEYWDQILAGLFHDAEESYTNDLASPLKACIRGKYKWVASGILRKIFERYGIGWEYHNQTVKDADNLACVIERFYFLPEHPAWPKAEVNEDQFPKPRLLEHEAARVSLKRTMLSALRVRNSLRREAAAC